MNRIFAIILLLWKGSLLWPASISIVPARDLNFSTTTPNSEAEVVAPTSSESSQFMITGNPNKEFTITLPSAAINMTYGGCSIPTSQWTSDTASPAKLGPNGLKTIRVGATRGMLASSACSGQYSGSHEIEVKYLHGGHPQSAYAKHKVKVIRSLVLSVLKDLIFPDCYTGEAAATISPADAGAASLRVSGDPNTAYAISFPSPIPVKMLLTGAAGTGGNAQIHLSQFTSIPMDAGKLDASGMQIITVGATRNAIGINQIVGNYSGSFLVRVTYL